LAFKKRKMVRIFCLSSLLLILFSVRSLSQDYERVYFNSKWLFTSIENSTYYRISKFDSSRPSYEGEIIDFYSINNQVEMTGFYKDGMKEGNFIFYYPNGNVKMKICFKDNERAGIWSEYYENGNTMMEVGYEDQKEKLFELYDIHGNSMLRRNKLKYNLISYTNEIPLTINDSTYYNTPDYEELLINGSFNTNNERDGKWTIKKNKELYATLSYSNGSLLNGYLFVGNQKITFNNNLGFPLFSDLPKFHVTEKYAFEPDAIIKNNYVLEGLKEFEMKSMKRVTINTYSELVEYIHQYFVLRSNKPNQSIKILIEVKNGIPTDCKTEPKISSNGLNELKLILAPIERLSFDTDNLITIDYIFDNDNTFDSHDCGK